MQVTEILRAWGSILRGRAPALSIEITRECPLRCPGCYAYEDQHLGGEVTLRQLSDYKGDELVAKVLETVDRERPLHLSIVGGDPLVRHREVDRMLPELAARGIHVQLVTSAFRPMPAAWAKVPRLNITVSIDGLQPEHDERRKPATYKRILESIKDQRVTVHCTVTGQMMKREGYLKEFCAFWAGRDEVKRIWFSIFTPQIGAVLPEILTQEERRRAIAEMLELRVRYPKLDMLPGMIQEFAHPPQSPEECIFARTTKTITADFKTMIEPCQFGGNPDCSQCGCIASMGLAAIGSFKLAGFIPVGQIFRLSARVGDSFKPAPPPKPSFPILGS